MTELPIINKIYDVYKNILEITDKIQKRRRYGIGSSLEESMLSCFDYLIMAKNAPKALKASYLIRASSKLEISTFKLRVILELALANETKIFQAQAKFSEIGRMLGGWLKSTYST